MKQHVSFRSAYFSSGVGTLVLTYIFSTFPGTTMEQGFFLYIGLNTIDFLLLTLAFWLDTYNR